MSKAKNILFCLLFLILLKSTFSTQQEIKDFKDFPNEERKFPPKKPCKGKRYYFNNNHTNTIDRIKKIERLERESHKLRKQNSRLVVVIIILIGIILIIISLFLFVKYYNQCTTKNQRKFYDELKSKNNKMKQEEKNESLNEKMIKNLEAPISIIESERSSKETNCSFLDDKENKGIIIIPNETDLQLYKPYDDINDDENSDIKIELQDSKI